MGECSTLLLCLAPFTPRYVWAIHPMLGDGSQPFVLIAGSILFSFAFLKVRSSPVLSLSLPHQCHRGQTLDHRAAHPSISVLPFVLLPV